jgi:hypothetical protein
MVAAGAKSAPGRAWCELGPSDLRERVPLGLAFLVLDLVPWTPGIAGKYQSALLGRDHHEI